MTKAISLNVPLRLGEAEKALHHYKHSGSYSNSKEVDKAQALKKCLVNCNEAQKQQKWNALLTETQFAMSSGANSAPLVRFFFINFF